MGGPADEHRRIAGEFTATVEGTAPDGVGPPGAAGGLGRPRRRPPPRRVVPGVPRWGRRDHAAAGPSVDDDPVGAWRTQTDAVQALLDDPATADREHDLPHIGRCRSGRRST